ncbi:metallophosphoesterase [uncultured Methanomethylovorans sp.]|uniref:metallophosphoesterase n=1 Tax=uncultured Methanomethylovorans sp. TaxID=183759 RepID=UPI002AA62E47|nr:metallophosphoesterase [uncultured Methanomethylovorans sp.]
MRIFAIADPHGNYSKIGGLLKKAGEIDLVLVAGDITNFGPDEKALELFELFDAPILAVPGNCDQPSILKVLDNSKAVNLHQKSYTIDDTLFIGYGGSNPTPFCTPFEMQECDIGLGLEETLKVSESNNRKIVLLTHAPPYGYLDEVPAGHVGCTSISAFIGKAELIVCGHIHEARGVVRTKGTVVVNPGMAALGYAALIKINNGGIEHKIEVELLKF